MPDFSCTACNMLGHDASSTACPMRHTKKDYSCGECKTDAHTWENCKKKKEYIAAKLGLMMCYNCQGWEHTHEECTNPSRCQCCGKLGHDSSACPKNACENCQQTDHHVPECPRCPWCSDEKDHPNGKCSFEHGECKVCGRKGHRASACGRKPPRSCHKCGQVGHTKDACTCCPDCLQEGADRGHEGCPKSNKKCRYCKEFNTHASHDCPRKSELVQCKNCGQQGHEYGNQCPAFEQAGDMCYHCHSSDHSWLDCPNFKPPVKCFTCKQTGHVSKNCPNRVCQNCGSPGKSYHYPSFKSN